MTTPHRKGDEAIATEAADTESLIAENASLHDRYLRALAEVENTRRRGERMAEEARNYAITEFARDLLQTADNLQRAVTAAEPGGDEPGKDASLLDGVRAIDKMLRQVLERFGIKRVHAQGARFDPALHEAVTEVDDRQREPGTIAEVLEEGYTIKDRLLRPARVAVVRRRPEQASSGE
jgi:molecular chaperone GrpE